MIDKVQFALSSLESIIIKSIRDGTFPFLGLYASLFTSEIKKNIQRALEATGYPLQAYLQKLRSYPAVFAGYLTAFVVEGFGTSGHFEVYPFIEEALRCHLTGDSRYILWQSYRGACNLIGLSVSPRGFGPNYMVEEYLRQAGVPLHYVEKLTDKMLIYAQDVGLPSDDDPASIRIWKQGLCERLQQSFSKVAYKAIESDDLDYYTRLFLRLIDRPSEQSKTFIFEHRMAKAIRDQLETITSIRKKTNKGLGIPKIIWRENQLGVELPDGENLEWIINVDEQENSYRGLLQKRLLPLDEALPKVVTVQDGKGKLTRRFQLWKGNGDNCFLIFDSKGILVTSGQLGGDPVYLEPGEFQFILRFRPSGLEEMVDEIPYECPLYSYKTILQPNQKVNLSRGPATVLIQTEVKPLILWEGNCIRDVKGEELYCSEGLRLKISIPDELIQGSMSKFILRLSPGEIGEVVELQVDRGGEISIDLDPFCEGWDRGLTRILAEISRSDVHRAVARSSIILWNGLTSVKDRVKFCCDNVPRNLNGDECDNLRVDKINNILTFQNEDRRFFRIAFSMGPRRPVFTFAVPGIFMQIKEYGDTNVIELPLKKGSTLSVSWDSRNVLEIFSSYMGEIRLGSFRKRIDSTKTGTARIQLTGLVDHIGFETNVLTFFYDDGGSEELVRLTTPHEILDFLIVEEMGLHKVSFGMVKELQQASLKAVDILSGETETLIVGNNESQILKDNGMNGWLISEKAGQNGSTKHEVRLDLEKWPEGIWFVTLSAKVNDRWGKITNARGDTYATGFIVDRSGESNIGQLVKRYTSKYKLEQKINIFARIHSILLECYSLEAWGKVLWLNDIWHNLIKEIKNQAEYLKELAILSDKEPPEDSSISWIPLRSISAEAPNIFAQPIASYKSIPRSRGGSLAKILQSMSLLSEGLLNALIEGYIHQLFVFGYENVQEIARGRKPGGFDFTQYEEVLKSEAISERLRLLQQDEWQPGLGDYLGALHYRYALKALEDNYKKTFSGNEGRRGIGLYMCRKFYKMKLLGIPDRFNGDKCLCFFEKDDDGEFTLEQEHLLLICKFLSLLAKVCRWESIDPGTLDRFITTIKSQADTRDRFEEALGFLLTIGKEIFCFYLLLWETLFTTYVAEQGGSHSRI